MACDSRDLIELFKNGEVSLQEVIQAELFSNIGCPYFNTFVRTLNKYLLDRERERKIDEFPTIQEGDK